MSRIVAIIQARMGSSRLPGKVLKPIAGKPLLWHVVHRLKPSRLIDEIVIATSTNPLDEAIARWGVAEGVRVICGPEENVLARFARAAELLEADIIVRVSSDAPFLDAGFIDHLIASLIEQGGDHVMLEEGGVCCHQGADPLTRRALDRLMLDAADDAIAREHVTGYFKLFPGFVRPARAASYPLLAREGGRLTIDTPDDLAFAEAVYARLEAKPGEASLADLLLLLEREPSLRAINTHVRQKPLVPAGALIRCDGGGKFGHGHVKRMVTLARALRDGEDIAVRFALNGSDDAMSPIHRAGFEVDRITSHIEFARLVVRHKPNLLILDGPEGPGRAEVEGLRSGILLLAAIDDASDRRLACDLAYYPALPRAAALHWNGARTMPRIGWQWALLGLDPCQAGARAQAHAPTLLVAMGGSDPFGLTEQAARALAPLDFGWRIRFVIGGGMDIALVAKIAAIRNDYEIVQGADDLSGEYALADLALCAFGVTAYELAAFGVPSLYLGLTEDHVRSATAFEAAGMGQSLGLAGQVTDDQICEATRALMQDAGRRHRMRAVGPPTIDGRGAARIAADLSQAVKEKARLRESGLPEPT